MKVRYRRPAEAFVLDETNLDEVAFRLDNGWDTHNARVVRDEESQWDSSKVPYLRWREDEHGALAYRGSVIVFDIDGTTHYASLTDMLEEYEIVEGSE